jgi:hypothetical protein
MPVARYFLFVGGVLLALLYALDFFAPREAVVASSATSAADKPIVRIHSDQKLPERVVYDTSLPTIVPPSANIRVAAAATAPPDITAQTRVSNTFAQFVPAESRKLEPQAPRKRKVARIAKNRFNPGIRFAQQQPRFGFFGGPSWNSTW